MTDKNVLFTEKVRDPSNNWIKMRDLVEYEGKGSRIREDWDNTESNHENKLIFTPDIFNNTWIETDPTNNISSNNYIEYNIKNPIFYYMYRGLMYNCDSTVKSINNQLCAKPNQPISFTNIQYLSDTSVIEGDILGIINNNITDLYKITDIVDFEYTEVTESADQSIVQNTSTSENYKPIVENFDITTYIYGLDTSRNSLNSFQEEKYLKGIIDDSGYAIDYFQYINDVWVLDNNYKINPTNTFTYENSNFRNNCFFMRIYDENNEDIFQEFYIWFDNNGNIVHYILANNLNDNDYDVSHYSNEWLSVNDLKGKTVWFLNVFYRSNDSINQQLEKNSELQLDLSIDNIKAIKNKGDKLNTTSNGTSIHFVQNVEEGITPVELSFTITSTNDTLTPISPSASDLQLVYGDIPNSHNFYLHATDITNDIVFLNYWLDENNLNNSSINIYHPNGVQFNYTIISDTDTTETQSSIELQYIDTVPFKVTDFSIINYYNGIVWEDGTFKHKYNIDETNIDITYGKTFKFIRNLSNNTVPYYLTNINDTVYDLSNTNNYAELNSNNKFWIFQDDNITEAYIINQYDAWYYDIIDYNNTQKFIRLPIGITTNTLKDNYYNNNSLQGYIYGLRSTVTYTKQLNHIRYFNGDNALLNIGAKNKPIYIQNGEFVEGESTDNALDNISRHILPSQNNTYNIGSEQLKWNQGYINKLNLNDSIGQTQLTGSLINIKNKDTNKNIFEIGNTQSIEEEITEEFSGIDNSWDYIPSSFSLNNTPQDNIVVTIDNSNYNFTYGDNSTSYDIENVGILNYDGDRTFNIFTNISALLDNYFDKEIYITSNTDEGNDERNKYFYADPLSTEDEDAIILSIPSIFENNLNCVFAYYNDDIWTEFSIPQFDADASDILTYWDWIRDENQNINGIYIYSNNWPIDDTSIDNIYALLTVEIAAKECVVSYQIAESSEPSFTFGTRSNEEKPAYSSTLGQELIAQQNQHVIGKYNELDTDALFIIGNGTETERSNILTVDNNSNLIIKGDITTQNIVTNDNNITINKPLSVQNNLTSKDITLQNTNSNNPNITIFNNYSDESSNLYVQLSNSSNNPTYRICFNSSGNLVRQKWNGANWNNAEPFYIKGTGLTDADLPKIPLAKGGTNISATSYYDILNAWGLMRWRGNTYSHTGYETGVLSSAKQAIHGTIHVPFLILTSTSAAAYADKRVNRATLTAGKIIVRQNDKYLYGSSANTAQNIKSVCSSYTFLLGWNGIITYTLTAKTQQTNAINNDPVSVYFSGLELSFNSFVS